MSTKFADFLSGAEDGARADPRRNRTGAISHVCHTVQGLRRTNAHHQRTKGRLP